MNGHWKGEADPSTYFGFVYLIENLENGRKYIGKKQYFMSNGKVKRNVNNRQSSKWNPLHWRESNWRTYAGSSKDLTKDIQEYGRDSFSFTILQQCVSKAQLHYGEIAEQVLRDVICEKMEGEDGQYTYYNKTIAAIKFRPPEYHTPETKAKLKRLLAERGHPMQGKQHPNKGKVLPQTAPHRCKAAHCFHITNGFENMWCEHEEVIPDGWRRGLTTGKKGKPLTDKEVVARQYASDCNVDAAHAKLADKAGYQNYEELTLAVDELFSDGFNRNRISKRLGIGWTTVDRIIKKGGFRWMKA